MTENSTQEIERKFLLLNDSWKENVDERVHIKQVYVTKQKDGWLTRLRITDDTSAEITIKGPKVGIEGAEYNLPMDIESAKDLWSKSDGQRIEKYRNIIHNEDGTKWEIDEFVGKGLDKLVLAEIELKDKDQEVVMPSWVGLEVSGTRLYSNDYLAQTTHETEDGVMYIPLSQNLESILKLLDIHDADPKAVDRALFKNILKREEIFGSSFTEDQVLPDKDFLELLKENDLKGTFSLRKLRMLEKLISDGGEPNHYHAILDEYSKSKAGVEEDHKLKTKRKM